MTTREHTQKSVFGDAKLTSLWLGARHPWRAHPSNGHFACAPALLAALLLAACSTPPPRPQPSRPTAVPPPPANIAAIPDAVPRDEPKIRGGANKPFYDVLGRRYYVLADADGYVERGVASWYGPSFHGASTAIGERYDMYGMTAAHKSLPLPCYARVTNLGNGLSVVVRINDRGPFVANRLIDLSYTAAARLDMLRTGTALVEVRVVTAPDQPPVLTTSAPPPQEPVTPPLMPTPAPQSTQGDPLTAAQGSPQALYVQAGAFAVPANAQNLAARLRQAGLDNVIVLPPLNSSGSRLYRVRLGPIASVDEFDQLAAKLAALGVPDARLAD